MCSELWDFQSPGGSSSSSGSSVNFGYCSSNPEISAWELLFWCREFFILRLCLGHHRIFSSTSGLWSVDARSTSPTPSKMMTVPNVSRHNCHPRSKSVLIEDRYSNPLKVILSWIQKFLPVLKMVGTQPKTQVKPSGSLQNILFLYSMHFLYPALQTSAAFSSLVAR